MKNTLITLITAILVALFPFDCLMAQTDKPPIIIAVDGLALREVGPLGMEPLKPFTSPIDTAPNGYLGEVLKKSPGIQALNAEIKTYTWGPQDVPVEQRRDPAYTRQVVDDLKKNIAQAYEVARNDGRPLVVIGHSWGGVLAYTALTELDAYQGVIPGTNIKGSDIEVASFITMGAPIAGLDDSIPHSNLSPLAKPFLAVERKKETLPHVVTKPLNVLGNWVNYWADNDQFSSPIPEYRRVTNVQIDKGSARTGLLGTEKWHAAYFMPEGGKWKTRSGISWETAQKVDFSLRNKDFPDYGPLADVLASPDGFKLLIDKAGGVRDAARLLALVSKAAFIMTWSRSDRTLFDEFIRNLRAFIREELNQFPVPDFPIPDWLAEHVPDDIALGISKAGMSKAGHSLPATLTLVPPETVNLPLQLQLFQTTPPILDASKQSGWSPSNNLPSGSLLPAGSPTTGTAVITIH